MASSPIGWLQGVGSELERNLQRAGYDDAESVQEAPMSELLAVDGVGTTRAVQLHEAAIIEPQTNRIEYRFECETELWESWKATIDDGIPIDAELRSLIRRRVQTADDSSDAGKVAAIQARQCTMRAMQSVAKDNEKARSELSEIMGLMDRILG